VAEIPAGSSLVTQSVAEVLDMVGGRAAGCAASVGLFGFTPVKHGGVLRGSGVLALSASYQTN